MGALVKPLARRSPVDLSPGAKLAAYLILVLWTLIVLFPLYWLVVTSFKLPIQVDAGPKYIPFVDFKPTLSAWRYIFGPLRNDTLRPYTNSVVVTAFSSGFALLLGSSAAYGLARFRYQPKLGTIGLVVGCFVLGAVAVFLGVPLPLDVVVALACFALLGKLLIPRFKRTIGNRD